VIVQNGRGEERALSLCDDRGEAERARDRTVARIAEVGIATWSHEMRNRIPSAFFE